MTDIDQIYQDYFTDVYQFLLKLSRNDQIAEELTADTFFKAINKIETFRGQCQMRVWLCQIAKNSYFSYLRKQKSYPSVTLTDTLANHVDIENETIRKETLDSVYKAIDDLQDPYRQVFLLRIMNDLSFKEIGQIMGKNDNWACVTYYRARQKMKQALEVEE